MNTGFKPKRIRVKFDSEGTAQFQKAVLNRTDLLEQWVEDDGAWEGLVGSIVVKDDALIFIDYQKYTGGFHGPSGPFPCGRFKINLSNCASVWLVQGEGFSSIFSRCRHPGYAKQQIDSEWISHSAVLVRVKRVCNHCAFTHIDWEWGDDMAASGPRMFPDDENFFTGAPLGDCLHPSVTKKPTGRSEADHGVWPPRPVVHCEYEYTCDGCGAVWQKSEAG